MTDSGQAGSALLLVAHGSPSARWRAPFERLAAELGKEMGTASVCLAYMEFVEPTVGQQVDALVAAGHTTIRVLPLFIAHGRHVERDIPALVEEAAAAHPDVAIELLPPIGDDDRTFDTLHVLAREAMEGS